MGGLDPPTCDRKIIVFSLSAGLLFTLFSCVSPPPQVITSDLGLPSAQKAEEEKKIEKAEVVSPQTDAALYQQADIFEQEGNYEKALEILRRIRLEFPQSELNSQVLFLSAQIHEKLDQPYRSRYFLKELIELGGDAQLLFKSALLLGKILYRGGMYAEAFKYYLLGVNNRAVLPLIEERNALSRAYLHMADIAYYVRNDRNLARKYLWQVRQEDLATDEELSLQKMLIQKMKWEVIAKETLKVKDGNISAISADGDDIWIGTWNGGTVRFSRSTGETKIFIQGKESLVDNTVRAIEVTGRKVWVGTSQGLSYYSKTSSQWHTIDEFYGYHPDKIQVVRNIDDMIFVGTLGRGLWRFGDQKWERIQDGVLPGDFINALGRVDNKVYIGTMNFGVIILDLDTDEIISFDTINSHLLPRNITFILPETRSRIWFGTYGDGLFLWERETNILQHYTKESGEISDNWLQCAVKTRYGMYFGTLGGGVSFKKHDGEKWRILSLKDGLASMNIACMSYVEPYIYIGTLGAGISVLHEQSYVKEL